VDFNRDIRPIFSETCFQCHGPDKAKRKAEFQLDTKAGAFAEAPNGPVIVPGRPDESELIARITSDDPEKRMPPRRSGRSLTRPQIELVRRWIAEGAEWRDHWAYLVPTRLEPRDVSTFDAPPCFARNDIDRFVLDRLAEKGLKPSPEADRVTLIRRLSFDLLGLPPSVADVEAFKSDQAPKAYERLVERMLASPHFGERMALQWLDLVRYADTTGYHGDNHRDVTLFRDYVIDAFNRNLSFDRFTIEQLAGDLLPNATDRERVSSGYNKLLMTTQEGGAQAKEYQAKYAADRVRNTSTVWMGTTLGCAECRDHKYDPFTTKDFYSFAAFFADIQEVAVGAQEQLRMPTPEQSPRARALDAEQARLQTVLDTTTPALARAQAEWERTTETHDPEWTVLRPEKLVSQEGTNLTLNSDGSILASGRSAEKDAYTLSVKTGRPLAALGLEVVPDGKLPALGPGRARNGNFVLTEFVVEARGRPVVFSNVTATHSQAGFPVVNAADGRPDTGWAILNESGRRNSAVFEAKDDIECSQGVATVLSVSLQFDHGSHHTLGRFRLSGTDAPRPIRAGSMPGDVAEALATSPTHRTDRQRQFLASYYRSIAPAFEPTRDKLAKVKKAKAGVEGAMPSTLVTRSGPPRDMRILPRANSLDESGALVAPAVPAFLRTSGVRQEEEREGKGERGNRLDLARWIVARENPLTACVFVNRLWKLAFGQGIVATTDDFGAQGTWPTHPELRDWPAVEFMDSGWDVKRIVRLLFTSGTYRQTSKASETLRQRDPYNQWLARQGRFRIDAEMVRDNALAVSGLLAAQVGGAAAHPYQPAGYWSHLNFPKREYQPDHGAGLYRRGLYTYWCRTFVHPSLLAFDAPTREECTVQRPRSNTPIQALVMLNDAIYIEAARAVAEHVLREGGDGPTPRFNWIYRLVLSREPRPAELSVLRALYEKHAAQYRTDSASADAVIHTGELPVPADLDAAELVAWTSVARLVLNLHETITRN
jgi:hypothetical protein